MNCKTLILSISAFCSSAVFAVDAVLNRQENTAQQIHWATASNWVDKESGVTLSEPPTNAQDNVFLPAPDNNIYLQRLGTGVGELTSDSRSFSVGSVTGDNRHKTKNGIYPQNTILLEGLLSVSNCFSSH